VLGSFLPGLDHLQNIHPLVVHFPIAMLTVAAPIYILAAIAGRESWSWVGLWMLTLGTIGAAAAAASGIYGAEGVMVAESVRSHLLDPHRNIMLGVLALSVALSIWALIGRPLPIRGRFVFLFLMVLLVAMVAKGADYGGRMVYDYNAGGYACSQPIDFSH
jgi:uncharacterized membrane protein